MGVGDPLPPLVVGRVGAVGVDRGGSLVVGVGAGVLRTGTIVLVGTLVVGLVGAGVLAETLGLLAGGVFFTTFAVDLAVGFAGFRAGVFAFGFAGFGLAAGFWAGTGAAG